MKRFVIALLLLVALPALTELTATLSKDEISELESVRLIIRLDGGIAPRDDPDFSALETDFEVHYEGSSSSTRIVNNNFTSVAEWRLILRPRRVATLTVPAITIGNYTTDELTLRVLPISEELTQKLDQEIFWNTNVDRSEQYVHGGIHIERKLYYSNNVKLVGRGRRGGIPMPQDLDDAHVVDLGSRDSNWDLRNGRSYNVLIHESVVFAEKSGSLTIPAASAFATIEIDGRTISKAVRAEPVTVTILPRPAEYPTDVPWLPATNILIKDNLEVQDLSNLKVGDSFSRVITIEALESYSTGIPEIKVTLPESIRSYPVVPEFENQVLGNKIIGIRTDEQAFVVTQAGEYEIPDAELVWWNTNTKGVVRTVIPGRNFSVKPDPNALNITTTNTNTEITEPTSPSIESTPVETLARESVLPNSAWLIMIAIAIPGWLIGLIFMAMWFSERRKSQVQSDQNSVEDTQIEALLKSDSNSDVKEGMLRWLIAKLQVSRITAIQLLQNNSTTAEILAIINAHQYGTAGFSAQLDHKKIKRALLEIEKQALERGALSTTVWQFYQPT